MSNDQLDQASQQMDDMQQHQDNGFGNTPLPQTADQAPSAPQVGNDMVGDYIVTPPQPASSSAHPITDAQSATPVTVPTATAATPPSPSVAPSSDDDAGDLLDIKQQALQQLSPLVGHLDQTPEEKFRTTMMMIQASDNQALLKDAYDAASKITDEKARAQALLDVVNEINYFTQQQETA